MEQFKEYRDRLDRYLHKKNAFTNVLETVEDKTKVSRVNVCLGLFSIVVLYLIFGYGGHFLANFIGFIYPAYCSIKAIESEQKDDDTKWLTYWVVYAGFSLVESVTDIFLYWIPLYALLKCLFLIYLMVPTSWNGSVYMYYNVIRPYVLKNEAKIDEFLSDATKSAKGAFEKVQEAGENVVKRSVNDAVFDSNNE